MICHIMQKNFLISIIIPVFNNEKYIGAVKIFKKPINL